MIEVVDAAYAPQGDDDEWAERILASLRAAYDVDTPAIGVRFEVGAERVTLAPAVIVGPAQEIARAMAALVTEAGERHGTLLRQVLLAPRRPIRSTSEVVGPAFELGAGTGAPASVRAATRDFVGGVVQISPTRGVILGVFQPRRVELPPKERSDITCLYAHLEAAATLRDRGPRRPVATLSARGASDVSEDGALRAMPRLERASAAMSDARSGRARLERWTARVDGRWSVVPSTRGASEVVANDVDDDALAPVERRLRGVAKLLADGHPQKLVAYELGIPEGSVYRFVAQLKRDLGAASTVELVALLRAMRDAGAAQPSPASRAAFGVLTPSERFAVESALAGLTAKEIADVREGSARTAENLLAAAYKKLGVRSRKELAARFGRA